MVLNIDYVTEHASSKWPQLFSIFKPLP